MLHQENLVVVCENLPHLHIYGLLTNTWEMIAAQAPPGGCFYFDHINLRLLSIPCAAQSYSPLFRSKSQQVQWCSPKVGIGLYP